MPSGLSSPRSRAARAADLGERSVFVARQRVGKGPRRKARQRGRLRRVLPLTALALAAPLAVAFSAHWLLTTPRVPVVSGLSDDELTSMKSAPSPKALAAIALIRALLRTGSALAAEISEIDMSRTDGPVLYTVDGVEVRLGAEDWEERLARLEGVLGQVADQDVRAVDLRFRDQVILQRRRS